MSAQKKKVTKKRAQGSAAAGPVPPYGPPIHDAIQRGDLSEMRAVADAARRVLFPVKFGAVRGEKAAEAKRALAELEAAIAKLSRG